MKIEFDKALLWLVPYLYLVSVMYYWGYWGTFEIDAFNYYAVSDLVKGVTAPAGIIIVYCLLLIVSFLAPGLTDTIAKDKSIWIKLLILFIITILTSIAVHYFNKLFMTHRVRTEVDDPLNKLNILNLIWYALCFVFSNAICMKINNESFIEVKTFGLQAASIFSVLLFPMHAFTSGKEDAIRIIQNKEFNYIVTDSLQISDKSIYKYLGKTGDFHIVINLQNIKYSIVKLDKLSPLTVEKFSLDDTMSIKRFKAHQKELIIVTPKQFLSK
jgi:hypothetical protein